MEIAPIGQVCRGSFWLSTITLFGGGLGAGGQRMRSCDASHAYACARHGPVPDSNAVLALGAVTAPQVLGAGTRVYIIALDIRAALDLSEAPEEDYLAWLEQRRQVVAADTAAAGGVQGDGAADGAARAGRRTCAQLELCSEAGRSDAGGGDSTGSGTDSDAAAGGAHQLPAASWPAGRRRTTCPQARPGVAAPPARSLSAGALDAGSCAHVGGGADSAGAGIHGSRLSPSHSGMSPAGASLAGAASPVRHRMGYERPQATRAAMSRPSSSAALLTAAPWLAGGEAGVGTAARVSGGGVQAPSLPPRRSQGNLLWAAGSNHCPGAASSGGERRQTVGGGDQNSSAQGHLAAGAAAVLGAATAAAGAAWTLSRRSIVAPLMAAAGGASEGDGSWRRRRGGIHYVAPRSGTGGALYGRCTGWEDSSVPAGLLAGT